MNAVMQPIHSSKGTERKISIFAGNLMDKFNMKEEEVKHSSEKKL
jgi:hypothetical protein